MGDCFKTSLLHVLGLRNNYCVEILHCLLKHLLLLLLVIRFPILPSAAERAGLPGLLRALMIRIRKDHRGFIELIDAFPLPMRRLSLHHDLVLLLLSPMILLIPQWQIDLQLC